MLRIAGQELDPRLIVFDKDGTLIAFEALWHARFARVMAALDSLVSLSPCTHLALAGTLGYDPETQEWDPRGPLTVGSNAEVALLMASQLYRCQGMAWDQALALVARAQKIALAGSSLIDLVEPVGDVRGTLQRLRDQGLILALATTDDRESTEQVLGKLGIAGMFATMVFGDEGILLKPAPDMALEICRRLGIAPQEAIMVGDTILDLAMAREAGFGLAVAVASGPLPPQVLAPHADLVIPDIHAIEVVSPNEDELP